MKEIKVLGTGCAKCKATMDLIGKIAKEKGIEIDLKKVEGLPEIMSYGIMSTPGIVVDGKVVHAGGVPSREKMEKWISD